MARREWGSKVRSSASASTSFEEVDARLFAVNDGAMELKSEQEQA